MVTHEPPPASLARGRVPPRRVRVRGRRPDGRGGRGRERGALRDETVRREDVARGLCRLRRGHRNRARPRRQRRRRRRETAGRRERAPGRAPRGRAEGGRARGRGDVPRVGVRGDGLDGRSERRQGDEFSRVAAAPLRRARVEGGVPLLAHGGLRRGRGDERGGDDRDRRGARFSGPGRRPRRRGDEQPGVVLQGGRRERGDVRRALARQSARVRRHGGEARHERPPGVRPVRGGDLRARHRARGGPDRGRGFPPARGRTFVGARPRRLAEPAIFWSTAPTEGFCGTCTSRTARR